MDSSVQGYDPETKKTKIAGSCERRTSPGEENMEQVTRGLVHFCHSLGHENLGREVTERAKYLLLDYLGVAILGAQAESSQPVYRMVDHGKSAGSCSVIGTALRTSSEYAALASMVGSIAPPLGPSSSPLFYQPDLLRFKCAKNNVRDQQPNATLAASSGRIRSAVNDRIGIEPNA